MLRSWSRGNYFRVGGENQINRRYADTYRETLSLILTALIFQTGRLSF